MSCLCHDRTPCEIFVSRARLKSVCGGWEGCSLSLIVLATHPKSSSLSSHPARTMGDWVSPQSSKVQMWVRRNFFHMFILVEGPMHLSFLLATTMQFVNNLVDWNFRNTAILSKATGWQSERLRSFGFAPTFSINWKQKERLISAVCCVFAVLFVFF